MKPWLKRLAFSFIILAAFLYYTAYRAFTGRLPGVADWQIGLYLIGGLFATVLAILGMRERHKRE